MKVWYDTSLLFTINFFVLFAKGKKETEDEEQPKNVKKFDKFRQRLVVFAASSYPWSLGRPVDYLRTSRSPSPSWTKCWRATLMRSLRPPASVHPMSARETQTTRRLTRPRSARKNPRAPRRPLASASTRPTGINSLIGVTGQMCHTLPYDLNHSSHSLVCSGSTSRYLTRVTRWAGWTWLPKRRTKKRPRRKRTSRVLRPWWEAALTPMPATTTISLR